MKGFCRVALLGLCSAFISFAWQPAFAACINPLTNMVDDATDCLFVEEEEECRIGFSLDFDGSGNPPSDPKKIECVDGAACDRDGHANGVCVFHVGVCLNVPTASCVEGDADALGIKKPSAKDELAAFKKPQAPYVRHTLADAVADLLPVTAAQSGCTDPNLVVKVPIPRNKKGVCNEPAGDSCAHDQECDDYCIIGNGKKGKEKIQVELLNGEDKTDSDSLKLTCLSPETVTNGAEAFEITDSDDLIDGPLAVGQIGDFALRNGRIKTVVRDLGRIHSFALLNGGQIVDADLVRTDGGEDRDHWLGAAPLIHVSSTHAPDDIMILNDGSDGNPAIVRATGPDDLFDTIAPSVLIYAQPGTSVPPDAIDNNLPLQMTTDLILPRNSDYVQIATKIENEGGTDLDLYFGEFLNPGGALEAFGPGLGYGQPDLRNGGSSQSSGLTLDFLAFQGQKSGAGVTYGVVFPETSPALTTRDTGTFTQSGVFAWLHDNSMFDLLFDPPNAKEPGSVAVPANGENTMRRWFVVGETVNDVTKARMELFGQEAGVIQGTVTVDGEPVEGAHVTILSTKVNFENGCNSGGGINCERGVVTGTLTDESGFYRAYVPGDLTYYVVTRADGVPYEDNLATPTEHQVVAEAKKAVVVDIDLPGTATYEVTITDQDDDPLPAKVSIVGVPTNADPFASEAVNNLGLAVFSGRYFSDPIDNKGDMFGIVDVRFADVSGSTGEFNLPPGDYKVVVSHGSEYDVEVLPLTVAAGEDATDTAQLNHVIDTTNFISIDTHVHMINSPDSTVTREDRIITMLAEGVDFFASTDHDTTHDLTDEVADLGASLLIKTAPGSEITTSHYGHFNSWPLTVPAFNPGLPETRWGSPFDWGRAGEPNGEGYPSDGSYDVAPRDIFASINPATQTMQINHFNSGTLGHFNALGIDSKNVSPPASSNKAYTCSGGTRDGAPCEASICIGGTNDSNPCTVNANCLPGGSCDTSPGFQRDCPSGTCTNTGNLASLLRMDPAETNLFDDGFTVLEVWIEANRAQTALLLGENMADWVGLLNQGIFKTGVADSDTHTSASVQAGGPRTYVASSTDAPASINPTEISQNTNAGRAIGSGGLFLTVTLNGDSGATATHALGNDLTVDAAGGGADSIDIHVESPTWAEFDTIDIYVNSVPNCISEWTFYGVVNRSKCTIAPTMTLEADMADFTINTVDGYLGAGIGQRLAADVNVPLTVTADSWVIVVARGTDGISAPLFPMNPQDLDDVGNDDLDDLTDSGGALPWNLGEDGQLALAFSNPLFFDFEGNGFCHGGTACP